MVRFPKPSLRRFRRKEKEHTKVKMSIGIPGEKEKVVIQMEGPKEIIAELIKNQEKKQSVKKKVE